MAEQIRIITRSKDGESVIYPTGRALALDTTDLLAAWTMAAQSGNTVHNDARADFDGQLQNGVQWKYDRTAGPCIRGDGSQQYVSLTNHGDYTGGVTFVGMINPHTSQTALIGARSSPYLSFGIRNAQIEVGLGNQQVSTSDSGLGLPQTNNWQMIGVRGNGSTGEWLHLYQGTITTGSFSYSWPTSGNYAMRLLNSSSTGHYLDGDQGLTLLYEREVGNDELAAIYDMVTGEW